MRLLKVTPDRVQARAEQAALEKEAIALKQKLNKAPLVPQIVSRRLPRCGRRDLCATSWATSRPLLRAGSGLRVWGSGSGFRV